MTNLSTNFWLRVAAHFGVMLAALPLICWLTAGGVIGSAFVVSLAYWATEYKERVGIEKALSMGVDNGWRNNLRGQIDIIADMIFKIPQDIKLAIELLAPPAILIIISVIWEFTHG